MTLNNYTIGLDLGDRKHSVCVLDPEANIVSNESIQNTKEDLLKLSARYPGSTIAMETGSHSPWVSRLLEAQGHRIYVANARKLSYISKSDNKRDEDDAIALARLARADPKLLHPIKHRSEACQRDLIEFKVRDALVRSRVNSMNSVRFLLKGLGVRTPTSVKASVFVKRTREQVDAKELQLVEPLLNLIDAQSEQISQIEKKLKEIARTRYPATQRLEEIPGVGPLTALCFVLTLESPSRFKSPRDVGPALGLKPRRDQSGESDKQLPITKTGNTLLRCLLVNCAHYILGPFGPPTLLRDAGLRICARGGKNAKKKAVIAVARKLAVTMMAMWQSGQDYRPMPMAA